MSDSPEATTSPIRDPPTTPVFQSGKHDSRKEEEAEEAQPHGDQDTQVLSTASPSARLERSSVHDVSNRIEMPKGEIAFSEPTSELYIPAYRIRQIDSSTFAANSMLLAPKQSSSLRKRQVSKILASDDAAAYRSDDFEENYLCPKQLESNGGRSPVSIGGQALNAAVEKGCSGENIIPRTNKSQADKRERDESENIATPPTNPYLRDEILGLEEYRIGQSQDHYPETSKSSMHAKRENPLERNFNPGCREMSISEPGTPKPSLLYRDTERSDSSSLLLPDCSETAIHKTKKALPNLDLHDFLQFSGPGRDAMLNMHSLEMATQETDQSEPMGQYKMEHNAMLEYPPMHNLIGTSSALEYNPPGAWQLDSFDGAESQPMILPVNQELNEMGEEYPPCVLLVPPEFLHAQNAKYLSTGSASTTMFSPRHIGPVFGPGLNHGCDCYGCRKSLLHLPCAMYTEEEISKRWRSVTKDACRRGAVFHPMLMTAENDGRGALKRLERIRLGEVVERRDIENVRGAGVELEDEVGRREDSGGERKVGVYRKKHPARFWRSYVRH